MDIAPGSRVAELASLGLLSVSGEDARAFLHAQLTSDVAHLPGERARYAGWCSAKGRLLATFLVLPHEGGFLLQLARDLLPAVQTRLARFVLRSKVTLADASGEWHQYGVMGGEHGMVQEEVLSVVTEASSIAVRIAAGRHLLLRKAALQTNAREEEWRLEEIRAGRPLVTQATQDRFVPQMLNFELLGGVDFHKGCYPGQEVVARARYRGQVRRRMYHVRAAALLREGEELFGGSDPAGTVVNAAEGEALAVLQTDAVEQKLPIRTAGGAALELLPLPYRFPPQ